MKNTYTLIVALIACMTLPLPGLWGKIANDNRGTVPPKTAAFKDIAVGDRNALLKKDSAFTAGHLYFLENKGQVTDQDRKPRTDIRFSVATGGGLNIFIGDGAIHYQFSKRNSSPGDLTNSVKQLLHLQDTIAPNGALYDRNSPEKVTLDMYRMDVELVGANKYAQVIKQEKQDYYENYFNEKTGEHGAQACAYTRIVYKDIYPHIDWVLYTRGGKLKHEFVVRQGGKVSDIRLKYGGATSLKLNKDGSLVAGTPMGDITEQPPESYQENGEKVTSNFKLNGSTVSYKTGAYTGDLVIDPTIIWGTYYGGLLIDVINAVRVSNSGNVYGAGYTTSSNAIATSGSYHATIASTNTDAFLVRFNASGVRQWATYYGGTAPDAALSATIDAAENIYITGYTYSSSGIVATLVFQGVLAGSEDCFLAKFSAAGALLWATYYGGVEPSSDGESGNAVTTDNEGNVYVGIEAFTSSGLATPGAYQGTLAIGSSGGCVLAKFNGAGTRLWATYYSGSNRDNIEFLVVDSFGNIYMTGETKSTSGIATSGAWQSAYGGAGPYGGDAFLAKFTASGGLLWATYFGGSGSEWGYGLALDDTGNVYMVGSTTSVAGISSTGAYQETYAGGEGQFGDAFLAKFDSSGVRRWATYYGGSSADGAKAIAIDHENNLFVTGWTKSTTGFATAGAPQETYGGSYVWGDAFLAKFDNNGIRVWGTYYGGGQDDPATSIALDPVDNIYIAGVTGSTSGIAVAGAYQATYGGGGSDAFLAKFSGMAPITGPSSVCAGSSIALAGPALSGTWSCGNPSVASVDTLTGIVTGVSRGKVVITYSAADGVVTHAVTVNAVSPVLGASRICIGSMAALSNAKPDGIWNSSAAAIATVGSGSGVVTALAMGTVIINYTDMEGCVASKEVTVSSLSACTESGSRIITTIAGNGTFGFTGDDGPATDAMIFGPNAIAADVAGNVYIGGQSRIRKVNTAGIITTIAGTGVSGYSGDGGPATLAKTGVVTWLAADGSGNLFISEHDNTNNCIRKIDASGIITTIAGAADTVYFSDGTAATGVHIIAPAGITTDVAGNVYVVVDNYVLKISASGSISVYAGNGGTGSSGDGGPATAAALGTPVDLFMDGSGNLYLATSSGYVRKINAAGYITTVAGTGASSYSGDGGPATLAAFSGLAGVAAGTNGNIYVVDHDNNRLREIDSLGIINTLAGDGSFLSNGDHCPATSSAAGYPFRIAVDGVGNVYFGGNARVRKIGNNHAVLFAGGHSQHSSICVNTPDSMNTLLAITDFDEQQPETWSLAAPPAHGTATVAYSAAYTGAVLTPAGLSYIPATDYTGPDSFKVMVADCGGSIDSTVVHVSVFPQPSPITGVPSVLTGSTTALGNDVAGGVWSTGSPMLASVDSSGIVTGINDGPAIISYTVGACYSTIIVTVSGAPVHKRIINSFPGPDVPSTSPWANFKPNGITVSQGYVFVASASNRILTFPPGYLDPGPMIIDVVGGTSVHGFSGDGDTATQAMVGSVSHLVVDFSRKVYFTDCDNHRVRVIDGVGGGALIHTIAGTGVPGSSGDGGPATAAQLNYPTGIARDPDGNIYVAESGRIRRINDDGSIITFAGNGSGIYSGDGGPATAAGFTSIGGIALDVAGNLFVACTGSDSRVRKISPAGIVTTVAGNGLTGFSGDGGPATTAQLNLPVDVAADNAGNIFITDKGNNRVRKVDAWGIISTVTGSGGLGFGGSGFSGDGCAATAAELSYPNAICTDEFGSVYISDSNNHCIRRVADNHNALFALGHIQHTNVTANAISVPMYSQLAVRDTDRLQAQVLTEVMLPVHGTLHGSGTYSSWVGIEPDMQFRVSMGTYYIPDSGYIGDDSFRVSVANCMDEHDTTTVYIHVIPPVVENPVHIITTVAGTGATGPYTGDNIPATNINLSSPGITTDHSGNLFILDRVLRRIFKVTPDGIIHCVAGTGTNGFSPDGTMAAAASFSFTTNAILVDNDGAIYINDNYCVRKISNTGEISTLITYTITEGVLAMAIDRNNGDLYFSHGPGNYLMKRSSSGTITTIAGNGSTISSGDGGPATDAGMQINKGLAVDAMGNVYITDVDWLSYNGVRKIDVASGIITTVAGSSSGNSGEGGPATMAQFRFPYGVAVDGSGNIYVADGMNNNIRKIDAVSGIFTNVTSNGIPGYSGDGCAATTASIHLANASSNICTDDLGNVYFADDFNHRVRKISVNHPVSFTGGHSQSLLLNTGAGHIDLAAQLAILDSDRTQPETMSLLNAPAHGTAHVDTVMAANGGLLAPGSLWYMPAPGYTGNDIFTVVVTDCIGKADTTTIFVTITADTSNEGRIITTIAGNGSVGSFIAGPATHTWINHTNAVETDNVNLFIASGWHTILMLTPDGTIRSVAGISGTPGYDGDGGPATAAKIGEIWYMAFDSASHKLYISDYANNCVRMIDGGPGGAAFLDGTAIITTIAGTGIAGSTGDGGPATVARLNTPQGIALDKHGNIYVAELKYIRKISTSGIISTVAGNGTDTFSGDDGAAVAAGVGGVYGITVDTGDNIYLACPTYFRVRKISSHGVITTVAGNGAGGFSGDGGPALAAKLNGPIDVFAARSGNVLFADGNNNCIRKISAAGVISTIAGSGPSDFSGINFSGDGCPATAAHISNPDGVCMDAEGNIYIADGNNQRIRKISNNHPVRFANGHTHLLDISTVVTSIPINDLLAVIDSEQSQTENWSILTAPLHGTLHADTAITSNGGLLIPGGLYYSPDAGYNGNDSFKVRVFECGGGTDTTSVYVHICTPVTGDSVVCKGSTISLTHIYTGGMWSCANPLVAGVSASGLVTGLSAGTALISYSTGTGCVLSKAVTVNPLPGAITGPLYVCQAATITLHSVSAGGTWSSSDTAVATAGSATGIVTGTGEGTVSILYSSATGCAVSRDVTVQAIPAAITGPSGVCSGNTITLSSTTAGGIWGPVTSAVAYVDYATGVVTGVGTGVVAISYTLPTGCGVTHNVTSGFTPPAIGGTLNICQGYTTILTNGAAGGTWSSSNTAAATIVAGSGLVTAIAPGTSVISYTTAANCVVTAMIYVNALPAAITGASSVCAGAGITLSNASVGGGTWSLSPASGIASIDNTTGLLTGISAGTAMVTYNWYNGCQATKAITVNPQPGAISGAGAVCQGLSVTWANAAGGGAWSSAQPAIAAVDGSGNVSGGTAGTTTITYTLPAGCYASRLLTVNAVPAAITGVTNLCIGSSTILHSSASGGTWSSSNTTVATITGGTGLFTAISGGMATITYQFTATGCKSTVVVTANTFPPPITGSAGLCLGFTTTLGNIAPGGTWISSNTGIATVDGSGVVTGIALGTATISYTLAAGCAASRVVTVSALPDNITGTKVVCEAATTNFICLTTGAGVWGSSNPSVASADSIPGVIHGVSAGTATISYSVSSACVSVTTVTVNPLPANITGTATVCMDVPTTLADATPSGTWSSSDLATGTVDAAGSLIGIAPGSVHISYTLATGCSRIAAITIKPLPPVLSGLSHVCAGKTITLTPTSAGIGEWSSADNTIATAGPGAGIVAGVSAGTTSVSFTLYSSGCSRTKDITVDAAPAPITGPTNVCAGSTIQLSNTVAGGTWMPVSGAVAYADPGSGLVTGIAPGTATITYTLGTGCTATVVIQVLPTPATISGPPTVCQDDTATFSSPQPGGIWTSGNTAVASVSASGLVTGITSGTVAISYTNSAGCHATRIITIEAAPAAITGTPGICTGTSVTFSDASPGGTWSAGGSANITVGAATGIVTGASAGTAIITYRDGIGCRTHLVVTADAIPPISGTSSVCTGNSTILGNAFTGGAWSSSDPLLAAVDILGTVTGITAGSAVITYMLPPGCFNTKVVTVNAGPQAISGNLVICGGHSTTFTDAVGGGSWTSSATSVATIGTDGVLTGIAPGTAMIGYQLAAASGACIAVVEVTVNADPAPITGAALVCSGATTQLNTVSSGGNWSSFNGTAATIDGAGLVTGIVMGTSVISYTSITTGCSALVTVTVQPAPTAITGSPAVCVGQSGLLHTTSTGGTWTSATAGIATIDGSGNIAGISSGIASVSYTGTNGCSSVIAVTVNALPAAITGNAVCLGTTTMMSNAAPGGMWQSSNPATAAIESATGIVTGNALGTAVISYILPSGCSAERMVTVQPLPSVPGGVPHLCPGASFTLVSDSGGGLWSSDNTAIETIGASSGILSGITPGTAHITYTNTTGCSLVFTATVNPLPDAGILSGPTELCAGTGGLFSSTIAGGVWSSGATGIATIGTTGAISGVSAGVTSISYSVTNSCGTATAVKTVTIDPLPDAGAISGPSNICIGATGTLSDAAPGGAWSSSAPGVATIGSLGVVSGLSSGTAIISYTTGNGCGSATVTKILQVFAIPDAGVVTGPHTVCVGAVISLSNTSSSGSWSSGTPAIAVIGTNGMVTGITQGITTISYSVTNGCATTFATYTVTVNPILTAGAITGTTIVCPGATTALSNTASPGGSWTSGAPAIATAGSAGIITGVAAGTASISYSVGNSCGSSLATTIVTVNPLPNAGVITGAGTVCAGAIAYLDNTTAMPGGTWASSSTGIATVVPAGSSTARINGVTSGTAVISYISATACGTVWSLKTVTVNAQPSAGIITGASVVCAFSTITLSNPTGDAGGTWHSSNPSVAVAGSTGIITGAAGGTAVISYVATNGCGTDIATHTVTVNPIPFAGTITGNASVCQGAVIMLGNTTAGGVWSSNAATIATVNSKGSVSGISGGTAIISYSVTNSCGTAAATKTVTVSPLPDGGVITGNTNLCDGSVTVLSNASAGGKWNSSDIQVAATDNAGRVTAVHVGTAAIAYTVTNHCGVAVSQFVMMVDPLPDAGMITGVTRLHVGATTPLNESVTGGAWSSGSPAIATVDNAGVVTGISAGNADISYTVANNCGSASAVSGVRILPVSLAFVLFPNPTTGSITAQTTTAGTLTICTIESKEMQQSVLVEGINSIDLPAGLAPGIYMCRFNGNDGSVINIKLVYKP